jgi:hypothetical protein
MTAKEWGDPAADASAPYGDTEISAASGVPLPSLRVLQAARAIQSQKFAKPHGGFRRTWSEEAILKASIAAAISEHFAWNIRVVSEAMAKTLGGTWDALVAISVVGQEASAVGATILIKASGQDWHLDLVDRKFLFLNIPKTATAILPDTPFGQSNLLLGMVKKDGFMPIPWAFGTPQGRVTMKTALGADGYQTMEKLYRVAMAAYGNFRSKATINASMQVRMASHRLHGRKAHFVQELISPEKRETDQ